jgi:hypothetical protein
MKPKDYSTTLAWLKTNPPLEELCARHPKEWATVQSEIAAIVERGVAEELRDYLARLSRQGEANSASAQIRQRNPGVDLSRYIRSRMAHESVKKLCLGVLAADAGVTKGKLRFNLVNGFIAQKLLFARELQRKPVSLFWFRLFWPMVWQRKRLMPLVQPRGIYCFYSLGLIEALAGLISSRRCLEIAAGDGTLTRFLKDQGVEVTATDSHGWSNAVKYPDWVGKLDARDALATHCPEVVICSWPPALNDFERYVFETPSVQLYVVIGSRHRVAFGNWEEYRRQSAFEFAEDGALGKLVLPPELESSVYLFRRKPISR